AERTFLGRTRPPIASDGEPTNARARQEAEERVERVAVLIDAGVAIPQIVWIVDLEAPADFAAWAHFACRGGGPAADEKVFVAEKFGSTPDAVEADERVGAKGGGVAVSEDSAHAKIFVDVVGDAAGEEIGAGNDGRGKRKIGDDLLWDGGFP